MGVKKPKPYNSGQWTKARFRQFIMSALRNASQRWGPRDAVRRKSNIDRGLYMCAGYLKPAHPVKVTLPPAFKGGKRIQNVFVDHIETVVPIDTGFRSWDETIERMFVEQEGFQVLCKECHDSKTQDEKARRKTAKES